MKAIIIAAGYGTRLGDLTKKIPKSRKKMNIEQILQQLESNSEKFQDSMSMQW